MRGLANNRIFFIRRKLCCNIKIGISCSILTYNIITKRIVNYRQTFAVSNIAKRIHHILSQMGCNTVFACSFRSKMQNICISVTV